MAPRWRPGPAVGHAGNALDHAQASQVGQHIRVLSARPPSCLDAAFQRHGLPVPASEIMTSSTCAGPYSCRANSASVAVAPGVERQSGVEGNVSIICGRGSVAACGMGSSRSPTVNGVG